MRLLLVTSLLALLEWGQVRGEDYCFKTDTKRPQTLEFGSKSDYNRVRGHDAEKFNVPGCKATKMWIYHRHGTRLMEKFDVGMSNRLGELRDLIKCRNENKMIRPNTLCDEDLIGIKKWRWNDRITDDRDLRISAKRYQTYFPDLLPRKYNSTYYRFGHTDTHRTNASFKAFAGSWFDNSTGVSANISNELLLAYKNCKDYVDKNNIGDGSEFMKFITGAIYNNTIANINKRLRLSKLYKDDIHLMYKMCRFELALKPKENSVWCAVFKPEEVTVLNYAEELKNYYGSGYGLNAGGNFNCLVVQDLLTVFNSTESPNVVAYFANSPGLQMLLVSLGIAKDNDTLRADNFEKMTNRKWKLSELVPFGANFVAVKYNCSEAADNVTEKAVFFLNEKAVEFEGCKKGLCNWSDVLKRYKRFSDANCKEEKPKMTREEFKEKEYEEEYEEYDVYIEDDECDAIANYPEGEEKEEKTEIIKEEENKEKEEKKGKKEKKEKEKKEVTKEKEENKKKEENKEKEENEALDSNFETAVFTINGGETIAPLMVTTLLTVIVRQLL